MKKITYKLGYQDTWSDHLTAHQVYFIDSIIQNKVERTLTAYIEGEWAYQIELEPGDNIEEVVINLKKPNVIHHVPDAELILSDLSLTSNNLN